MTLIRLQTTGTTHVQRFSTSDRDGLTITMLCGVQARQSNATELVGSNAVRPECGKCRRLQQNLDAGSPRQDDRWRRPLGTRVDNQPRSLQLTDKAYAALGLSETVWVPMLDLPYHRDRERAAA